MREVWGIGNIATVDEQKNKAGIINSRLFSSELKL
jgi:hypothetical protein